MTSIRPPAARLLKDKLWFFTAHRWWGTKPILAGLYYNATPQAWTYTPDLSRQAIEQKDQRSNMLRLQWQATPRNKISVHYDNHINASAMNPTAG